MWLLTYSGERELTSFRHPEQLTELAPKRLQDACLRWGGRNLRGQPNFRLVRVSSRYMIAGGHEFVFHDDHGNYQKTCPTEMLVPRYQAEKTEWELYLLERWRPPEWFYKNSFAGRSDDVQYDAAGHATRVVEPIWPEGGYEACWWDVNQLFVFPRNVGTDSGELNLRWAIGLVLRAEDVNKKTLREAIANEAEHTREKDVENNAELWKESGKADLFLEPAISMANTIKESACQPEGSCASEPATD